MTPRIKKAYRHFNAFLQYYQCRQSFWRTMQKKANDEGRTYQGLKTKLKGKNTSKPPLNTQRKP